MCCVWLTTKLVKENEPEENHIGFTSTYRKSNELYMVLAIVFYFLNDN